jgi:flagellar assembly factor FliW
VIATTNPRRHADDHVEERMTAQPNDLPTIDFASPMPGFPGHRQFILVRLDEDGLMFELASTVDPELRFLVIPPTVFFPDYTPEISEETLDALGLDAARLDQVLTLLVVTVGATPADATANLLAPILIDQASRRAVQVILTGTDLPVRAGLVHSA